jgi:hypothetical protein
VLTFNGFLELICAHFHDGSLARFTARSSSTRRLLAYRRMP